MNMEQHTIGPEKVSVVITRKTKDDMLVSQNSGERWFISKTAADAAQRRLLNVFIEEESELISDGDELTRRRERAGHKEEEGAA